MWLAVFTALVVAHATPELAHVRRDPLTVKGVVDEVAARHGVVRKDVEEQIARALRDGGIRVRAAGTSADEFPGASVTVSVDGFEAPREEGSDKVAFTIRVSIRQAVLLPDRLPAFADIWSLSLLGVSPPDALARTIRDGLEPVMQRLGDDLGAGHPEPSGPSETKAPPNPNVISL